METRQEAKAKLKQFGIDACVYTLILVIAFTLIETTNSFFQIKSNSFFGIAGLALGLIYWKRVLLKQIIHGFNTKSDEELEAAGKEFRKSVLKKAGGFLVVVILFAWVLNTYIKPGAIYDIVGYQVCERAVGEAVKEYAGKISAIQNVVKSERPALKSPANAQRVVASCMGDATINGSTMKVAIYKWFVKSGNDSGFEYHIEPVALDALTNLLGTLGNQENSKDGSAAEKEAKAAPAQPDAQPSPTRWYADVTTEPDAAFENRVRAFLRAVIAGDREAAANAVSYPLQVNGTRPTVIRNKAELLASWDRIFTPTLVSQLRAAIPHEMFVHEGNAMLGDGIVWFDARGASTINEVK